MSEIWFVTGSVARSWRRRGRGCTQFAEFVRGYQAPSDPRKVAELIVSLTDREDAPVLLVGPDAVVHAGKAAEALAESDRKWRDVSLIDGRMKA